MQELYEDFAEATLAASTAFNVYGADSLEYYNARSYADELWDVYQEAVAEEEKW